MREVSLALWANPTTRETMIARMRASNADPTVRQKKGSLSKERWADPMMRKKIIAAMRAAAKSRRKRDTADG
jgi:hypothetical protein